MTESVNPTLTKVETLFQKGVLSPAITAFLTTHGLNFWPVNAIVNAIFMGVWSQVTLEVDETAIPLLNSVKQTTLTNATIELQKIADTQGTTSDAYLKLQTAALAALSDSSHYN